MFYWELKEIWDIVVFMGCVRGRFWLSPEEVIFAIFFKESESK